MRAARRRAATSGGWKAAAVASTDRSATAQRDAIGWIPCWRCACNGFVDGLHRERAVPVPLSSTGSSRTAGFGLWTARMTKLWPERHQRRADHVSMHEDDDLDEKIREKRRNSERDVARNTNGVHKHGEVAIQLTGETSGTPASQSSHRSTPLRGVLQSKRYAKLDEGGSVSSKQHSGVVASLASKVAHGGRTVRYDLESAAISDDGCTPTQEKQTQWEDDPRHLIDSKIAAVPAESNATTREQDKDINGDEAEEHYPSALRMRLALIAVAVGTGLLTTSVVADFGETIPAPPLPSAQRLASTTAQATAPSLPPPPASPPLSPTNDGVVILRFV